MTKYLSRWQEIIPVEVERETTDSIWINGRKCRKITQFECYHDTFDQAKGHIVLVAEKAVSAARRQLAFEEGKLERAKSVKETTT